MSPRPRTIDDDEILAAGQRVMQRVGPAKFTLQLVAAEAGVSAPTLIQRFGSKRAMLRRMSAGSRVMGAAIVADLRGRHRSPLVVLREFLLRFAAMARTPKEMVHHLSWLQMDLTDPVMHRHFVQLSRGNAEVVRELLEEAVAAGELAALDAPAFARVLTAQVTGSLIAWAACREGAARAWLERDLDLLLSPYRTARTRAR